MWVRRDESGWAVALRGEEREIDLVAEFAGEEEEFGGR
jgi:hypothetical protein